MSLVNYDVRPLSKLFSTTDSIDVPIFQRPYSWSSQYYVQFIDDLKRVIDEDLESYFIGSIFFKEKDAKQSNLIIDGQQRLATATILISVIRDMLFEIGDDRVSDIETGFLKKRNLKTRDTYYKINLSEINLQFFRSYIQEKDKPSNKIAKFEKEKNIIYSNKLIFDCYSYYYTQISGNLGKNLDQKNLIELLVQILDILLEKFYILSISVTEESEAFTIFETLNDRGMDLTIADLLKNYLFSIVHEKISGSEMRDCLKKWDNMIESLGKYISPFLKHYWNSKHKPITEKEVYRALKKNIRTKDEVLSFFNELFSEAEIYAGFINPEMVYWNNKKIVNYLNEILTLGVSQCYPLLLSAKSKMDDDNFIKIILLSVNLSFRYSTVCNLHNNLLERFYSSIANEIRVNKIKGSKGVAEKYNELWPKDQIYEEMFSNMTFKTSNIPKYILRKINDSLDEGKEIVTSDEISWEHIIPKNPSKEYIDELKKQGINYKDVINKFSNMTLLGEEYNQKSSNKKFIDKKEMYDKSKLSINKLLQSFKIWDQSQIDDWNKFLLDNSKKIWVL